jgi:hypothetical protein
VVKEYIRFSRAEQAVKSVDEQLLNDKKVMKDLIYVQEQNPDFTVEDLEYLVKEAFKISKVDAAKSQLNDVSDKKLNKDVTNNPINPKKAPIVMEEYASWDDL